MDSPSVELRLRIAQALARMPSPQERSEAWATDVVAGLLDLIGRDLERAIQTDQVRRVQQAATAQRAGEQVLEPDLAAGDEVVATVQEWASVVSYVLGAVYGPASPMPRQLVGWAKTVTARLQRITKLLLTPLSAAAQVTGASSWSIGVGFPWGVSVGLTWP
jgi:hypothetical protein